MAFEKLDPRIQDLIEEKGWSNPTHPQQKAIPTILDGEDVLLTAPTGIGKTEAAMLPLLDKILNEDAEPISLLYVTPLRALNRDMFDRLLWWCRKLDLEVAVRHGDTSDYERRKQAEFPEQIFVTTPETLQAILPGSKMKEHLKNVNYLVVDEIHELVSSKRGTQLSLGIERLKELCGDPQLIGLSATVGSPKEVASFLSPEAKIIKAGEASDFSIEVDSPLPQDEDEELSEELLIGKDIAARLREIHQIIEDSESSLVFTNTRESSEVLSSRLHRMDKKYDHSTHHSSLSKDVRIESEDKFKEGDLRTLICTSSLELGIDIGRIDTVVQYGSPRRVDKLLQRIGRSGHSVKDESRGKIIALDADDIMEATVIAQLALGENLEETEFHKKALDVLGNQIIGICIDEYSIPQEKIFNMISNSYYYKDLSQEKFYEVLHFLSNLHYIWINEDGINRSKKAWEYYYENLSTIPDIYQYRVVDSVQGKNVGQLDESFVAEYGETGTTFVMKGRSWRIISVDEGKVYVEPVEEVESAVPAWEGELIPVPQDVARGVGKLRRKILELDDKEENDGEIIDAIRNEYPISRDACKKIIPYVRDSKDEIASDNKLLLEQKDNFTIIHSCNGTLVNQTLGKYLASLLIEDLGRSVAVKQDPYRIMLKGTKLENIRDLLENSDPEELEYVLDSAVEKSQMFKWRFIHAAKRMGAVQSRAKWDQVNISRIIDSYEDSPIFDEAKREVFQEKMDVSGAKKVLDEIDSGVIKIEECGEGKISEQGLTHKFQELLGPEKPKEEIFKIFKQRVRNTKLRLLCTRCGEYKVTKRVRDIEEDIKCPVCGSGRITAVKPYEKEKEKVIDKIKEDKDLTEEEKEVRDDLEEVGDYVLTYGKKFLEAIGGKGVGPETAIRILAKQYDEEDEFYEEILEKEKEYTRTKKFWAD